MAGFGWFQHVRSHEMLEPATTGPFEAFRVGAAA